MIRGLKSDDDGWKSDSTDQEGVLSIALRSSSGSLVLDEVARIPLRYWVGFKQHLEEYRANGLSPVTFVAIVGLHNERR